VILTVSVLATPPFAHCQRKCAGGPTKTRALMLTRARKRRNNATHAEGAYENKAVKIWIFTSTRADEAPGGGGMKGYWTQGRIHEYVSAKKRNEDTRRVCDEAVCTCLQRTEGMYRFSYKVGSCEVSSYFSDGDETVQVDIYGDETVQISSYFSDGDETVQ
jgi:hypothetical protein